jgi:hypothetical protein
MTAWLIASSRAVLPVSTCPTTQQTGFRYLSLLPACFVDSP